MASKQPKKAETATTAEAPDAQQPEIQALSSKQIKKIAKPEFAANPDKFYPTETLKKMGFSRAQCPKCGEHFWRHSPKVEVCGDSNCVGSYQFIGRGTGIGRKGQHITYAQAWEGFKRSLTSARVPCTAIHRYPVVARWRTDVDYVAAGIYCFQPHCVTGELEPPANPLICDQFCLRFNDLDNIGLTGRHFSGFVMLGIQVFNTPQKYVFFKDECVEFNYRWLTEELGIDPDEITFIEDVWCGGGNLGPSIEYFVGGLELGNMVFMQYKVTNPCTGAYEPLKVQVIDTGIGLERIPWLINGTATSYLTTFPKTLELLSKKLNLPITTPAFEKFGPYSCLLNVDEVSDINAVWDNIAAKVGMSRKDLLEGIAPVRDMYIVCDHTRSVLMAIEDGSLPSSVGGASNLRNVLRRTFMLLHKNGWWDKIGGMDGLLEIFQKHREELAELYGPAPEYKSFADIIKVEYQRWSATDEKVKTQVAQWLKKKKGAANIKVQDWIDLSKNSGIGADAISEHTGMPIPDNYFSLWAELDEQKVRPPPEQLYDTAEFPEPTRELFYENGVNEFDAKILSVMERLESHGKKTGEHNVVVLDQTDFYPLQGGQDNDVGTLVIDGVTYQMTYAEKVGKVILHFLDKPLPNAPASYVGKSVHGAIDVARRTQLRNHHTATHIVYQAARRVLGPHVWQHGAKKTVEEAHLDITHFAALTKEQEQAIENEANRAVRAGYHIKKTWEPKEQAERKHGFKLYQGGVAAGSILRVVDIEGFDTEACCGTHCDNTSEVGFIRIIRSNRLADNTTRLHFVAGERALAYTNEQSTLLSQVCDLWGVQPAEVLATADRIFKAYKKFSTLASKQALEILQLQIKTFLGDSTKQFLLVMSEEPDDTIYHSALTSLIPELKKNNKAVVVLGKKFIHAVFGSLSIFNLDSIDGVVEASRNYVSRSKKRVQDAPAAAAAAPAAPAAPQKFAPLNKQTTIKIPVKGSKPLQLDGVMRITGSLGERAPVEQFFREKGFEEFKM